MKGMGGGSRNGILAHKFQDKTKLYSAYMPFVKNGGLFIETDKTYNLGDEVFLLLSLLDEPEKLPVAGKVIWLTPNGSHGNRAPGIGIQFSDKDTQTQAKIETLLAGSLESTRPTSTL